MISTAGLFYSLLPSLCLEYVYPVSSHYRAIVFFQWNQKFAAISRLYLYKRFKWTRWQYMYLIQTENHSTLAYLGGRLKIMSKLLNSCACAEYLYKRVWLFAETFGKRVCKFKDSLFDGIAKAVTAAYSTGWTVMKCLSWHEWWRSRLEATGVWRWCPLPGEIEQEILTEIPLKAGGGGGGGEGG